MASPFAPDHGGRRLLGAIAPTRAAFAAEDSLDERALRAALCAWLLKSGRIEDPAVVQAILEVPRHLFVPPSMRGSAYDDRPLPIGQDQTIAQPLIVAEMTQALELRGTERVLEIGTGSGYHAAVLSLLSREVFSIERIQVLGERARARLASLGYRNVHVAIGDGYAGWAEQAPFDRILLTAAPPEIPRPLEEQLAEGGILVAPVGEPFSDDQRLCRGVKSAGKMRYEDLGAVRFVPMETDLELSWS